MKRSTFLRATGLTLGAIAFMKADAFTRLLNDPAYKIKMLTDDIGVFTESGGTILFIRKKEGVVVVDAQFPESARHLIDEIKKQTDKPFHLLINTHHHGDHTAGNIAFKGLVPHVLAHENSKINQQRVGVEKKTEDQQLYPDLTYTDTWCEDFGKEKICLHYFGPGHTNGDSLVHLQHSNIVHMGDLVFNRRHPFIDKTAGAEIANWITLLQKATDTFGKKATYVCGHAAKDYDIVLNAADLLAFRDYLGNLLSFTEVAIKAGKTKDEILKATEIPGSPEWKGDGIERPLTAAYIELTTTK